MRHSSTAYDGPRGLQLAAFPFCRPVQYSDFVRHAVPGAVDPFDIGAPLILRGYLRLLTSPDASVRAGAAEAWGRWERAAIAGGSGVLIRGPQAVSPPASRLGVTETSPGGSGEEWGSGGEAPDIGAFAQDMSHGQVQALLTCWYSLNLGFGVGEELMRHPERLRGIPCIAVQVTSHLFP